MVKSNKTGYFRKQVLRGRMSKVASYAEIYVSALVLIGILLLSLEIIHDIFIIGNDILHGTSTIQISTFLSTAFELIIGIEFVKMLAKHTPSSAVEVLLYAIARQLINSSHNSMIDALIGVIAIAILFAVRKYLSETIHRSSEDEFVVNGSISVSELNDKIGANIDPVLGNTIAGVLYNSAKVEGATLKTGYEVKLDNYIFQVYSMDSGLIKQIKIDSDKIS